MSGVDTGPDLTATLTPAFFRIIPSDTVAAKQLALWAQARRETKGAIVFLNDTWGSALKKELERSYAAAGGTIVATQEVGQGQDVFRPVVAALAQKSPQVVFLFVHPREAALLIAEARRQALSASFIGTDNLTGAEFASLGGAAVEGAGYVVPGGPTSTPARQNLLARYQAKFGAGKEPPLFTVMGYDAMRDTTS
jgi:branched-chain amino acid transport system substrate-binding protein